jgi:hypothetical protein
VQWDVTAPGRLIRGQGTSTITFTSDSQGIVRLAANTLYPDTYCRNNFHDSYAFTFNAPGYLYDIVMSPTSIPVGGTAGILFKVAGTPQYSVSAPYPRSLDLRNTGAGAYTYHDQIGAGTVPITLRWVDPCTNTEHSEVLTLTIGQ